MFFKIWLLKNLLAVVRPAVINNQDMKFFAILLGIFLIFVKSGLCLRLEDLLPMKYDVVKVRSEKQLKSRGDAYAVLDFVSIPKKVLSS